MARRISEKDGKRIIRMPKIATKAEARAAAQELLGAEADMLDKAGISDTPTIGISDPNDPLEKALGPEWKVMVVDLRAPDGQHASVVSINGNTKAYRFNTPTVMRERLVEILENAAYTHRRKIDPGSGLLEDRSEALRIHRGYEIERHPDGTYLVQRRNKYMVRRMHPVREVLTAR